MLFASGFKVLLPCELIILKALEKLTGPHISCGLFTFERQLRPISLQLSYNVFVMAFCSALIVPLDIFSTNLCDVLLHSADDIA
jgi:hypothetical protein